jgi:hypothetical protein
MAATPMRLGRPLAIVAAARGHAPYGQSRSDARSGLPARGRAALPGPHRGAAPNVTTEPNTRRRGRTVVAVSRARWLRHRVPGRCKPASGASPPA